MLGANLIILALLGQAGQPEPDPAALLEKLGSARYAEREAAKSLETLGKKALPALRSGLKSKDPEVRMRARAMIDKIEGNLLIEGTEVRLDFKDATLDEIVRSLSKQTGFEVGVGMQRGDDGSPRITIREPRPVPFWMAINRLCEVGQLTCEYRNNMGFRPAGTPMPTLSLSPTPDSPTPPSAHHGPFRMTVDSLFYQVRVAYQAYPRMIAPPRPGRRRRTAEGRRTPARGGTAGDARPGAAERAGKAPARIVQFDAHFRVVPEPRMTIRRAGPIQLLEAVDDLGNSLLPAAADQRTAGPTGMMGPTSPVYIGAGSMTNVTAPLQRPEKPGQVIKTLRGTVEVEVSAPRTDALVIPIAGSAGKTFDFEGRRVVVNSVDANPDTGQTVIELAIDDLDELLNPDPAGGPAFGPRGGMMGMPYGSDPSQSPIQVILSQGQSVPYQTTMIQGSGRITLRVHNPPTMGPVKEIRISGVIRSQTKIPFEFHDLPMP